MKGLFGNQSPADDPVPAAPAADSGGWAGLSGRAKLGIMAGVATAALAAVMWPGLNTTPPQVQAGLPNNHAPAPISDYQAPPPVEDVVNRVTSGSPPPRATMRTRPMPTEMALYAVKPPAAGTTTAVAASGASGVPTPTAATDGLPPTNRATIVRHPDFLIRAGDAIPCLPVEANRSDKPSFTTCEVPVWFRSSNQRRGLLPPHTRLFGQIRDGLQAGEQRLGIVFSVIQTKWFDMPVASSASDVMGRGGVDADVKTFFWDRAGAVALYALMDAAVGTGQNLATSAMSNSFGGYGGTSFNFSGPAQSLASREFDHRINRPPLATRDQALPITVIVGQNLDFYDACQQAMRVDPMACPLQ